MTKTITAIIKFVLLTVVSILTFSCAGTQKMKSYKQLAADNKKIYQQSLDNLNKADSARSSKFAGGKLDNISNEKIEDYIDSLRKISMNHLKDDSIISKQKVAHKNIDFMLAKAYRIAQEAKMHTDNVTLINELLSTNTFTQLNMSSFFGSGQYILDGEYKLKAVQSFQPVVNDVLSFAGKFPDKKLSAIIVVIGYADAQPINLASELAGKLGEKLGKTDATSQDLNKELSRLRAGSATIIIRDIINDQKTAAVKWQNLSIEMLPQGRGEELPNPLISDYKTDDERRRVVNVFWSLLPVF